VAKVEVYRFKRRIPGSDQYKTSTRMATRKRIESMKTVELIDGTAALVDVSRLIPGAGWTEKNFDPGSSA
jgi:hypothetical protein